MAAAVCAMSCSMDLSCVTVLWNAWLPFSHRVKHCLAANDLYHECITSLGWAAGKQRFCWFESCYVPAERVCFCTYECASSIACMYVPCVCDSYKSVQCILPFPFLNDVTALSFWEVVCQHVIFMCATCARSVLHLSVCHTCVCVMCVMCVMCHVRLCLCLWFWCCLVVSPHMRQALHLQQIEG